MPIQYTRMTRPIQTDGLLPWRGCTPRVAWLLRALALLAFLGMLNVLPKRLVVYGPQQTVETLNPKIGVHTRLTDEVDEWKVQRALQMVREMGSPWIVEYFPWGYSEPSKGRYSWGHADRVVDHALARQRALDSYRRMQAG